MPTIPSSKQSIDGLVRNQLDTTLYTWSDARDDTTGSSRIVNPTSMSPDAYEQTVRGQNWVIERCMLSFDFSGVSGTITSLHLKLYKTSGYTNYKNIIAVKNTNTWGSGLTAQLSTSDYNVDFTTPYSGVFNMGPGGTGTAKTIALNNDAKTDAVGNSNFNIGVCDYTFDYSDQEPGLTLATVSDFYYNNSSYYPRIEYTLDTGFGEIVNGVIAANMNKILNVGRLNVEKVIDTPYTAIPFCNPNWDIGDITTGDSKDITSFITGSANGAQVQPYVSAGGMRMYIPQYSSKRIVQMSIATAHDLTSTITAVGASPSLSNYFALFQLANNGEKAYVSHNNSNSIVEYNLTAAWDITTMSTSGTTLNLVMPTGESLRAFHFNYFGTRIYAVTSKTSSPTSVSVFEIPLSTGFDISTAGTPTINNITTTGPTSIPRAILPLHDNYNDYYIVNGAGTDDTLYVNGVTNANYDSQANVPGLEGSLGSTIDDYYIYYVKRTGLTNNYTWTLHQLDVNMNFCSLP